MSDNKDITETQNEFELKVLHFISKHTDTGGCFYHSDFLADLRQIMPPTCGVEQRKFLDEVEQLKALTNEEVSLVSFDDFNADLDKVFEGE
jgi:hypothetical protein